MIRRLFKKLGPGLITGAADDDPSGIGTYSQAGAQFGFGMLWAVFFTIPLMCGIQEISGRIGRVTGQGIAGNMCRYYPRWVAFSIVFLLMVANVVNIGADLGAMADSVHVLIGGPVKLYIFLFTLIMGLSQIFIPYTTYVNYLKWLTVVLFCYVAMAFYIHVPWKQVLEGTFLPQVSLNHRYLTTFAGVMGTTISPYLFFWQASEEVEELTASKNEKPLKRAPSQAKGQFERIKIDTYTGMVFSNIISYFIILTTAATLHVHGVTDIQTATQAADALKPIAGNYAFLLFALGIIGTGLLSIPILAASAGYGLGEALKCKVGLELKFSQAKIFYLVIAVALSIGMLLNFLNINPMKALFWSAVINGVISVPLLVVMVLMASNPKVMGPFVLSKSLKIMGWLITAVMFFSTIGLFL